MQLVGMSCAHRFKCVECVSSFSGLFACAHGTARRGAAHGRADPARPPLLEYLLLLLQPAAVYADRVLVLGGARQRRRQVRDEDHLPVLEQERVSHDLRIDGFSFTLSGKSVTLSRLTVPLLRQNISTLLRLSSPY